MSTAGISFSGLFSGLDTESIIEQLIYIEREPIRLLETKKTRLDYEKQDLTDVNNSLLALKSSLSTFASGITLKNEAISENESIFTASATAAAAPGEYDITVEQLATKNYVRSTSKAASWTYTDQGVNTFQINMTAAGGPTFTVTLFAGDTLSQVASRINGTTAAGEVFSDYGTAYVITDPSTGAQVLRIEAVNEGTANRVDVLTDGIVGPGGALEQIGIFNSLDNHIYAHPVQDAIMTIDGVTLNNTTNQFVNPLTGVTINLVSADPGVPYKLTVGPDDEAVVSAVKAFVDQFNKTTDLIAGYVTEDPVKDPETTSDLKFGVLRGDYDLVSIKADIRIRTTGYVDGSIATYNSLALIGIESEPSLGSYVSDNITFDEETFRAALADNKDEVYKLLENWSDQLDQYLQEQTRVSSVQEFAGTVYSRVLGIDDRIESIDDDIETWEDRVAAEEERLRSSFALMEELLQQLQTQSVYVSTQLQNLINAASTSTTSK
ncbi:MAG: flagellar filament capping protein FliD [bacterium]